MTNSDNHILFADSTGSHSYFKTGYMEVIFKEFLQPGPELLHNPKSLNLYYNYINPTSQLNKLEIEFDLQKVKYSNYLPEDITIIDSAFKYTYNLISQLGISKSKLYLLDNNSIFFKIVTKCGLKINLQVYYDSHPFFVVFAINTGDQSISQNSGEIDIIFSQIKEIIELNRIVTSSVTSEVDDHYSEEIIPYALP